MILMMNDDDDVDDDDDEKRRYKFLKKYEGIGHLIRYFGRCCLS